MNLRPSQPEEDALFDFGHDGRTEPATDLERTLSRLQRAAGSGQETAMPPTLRHQILEDIMHAHAAAPAGFATTGEVTGSPRSTPRPIRDLTRPASSHRPWLIALNTLMAAALIAALAGAAWRIGWDTPFGGGGDPKPTALQFGGFLTQDDDGSIDPAELPTADDCTVEPLTVDEVLWYVTDTYEASYSLDMDNIGPMPTDVVSATPPATNPPNYVPGHASQEDLDAAASTQFMLTACVLADSYFQVWALLAPSVVAQQVQSAFPPLTSMDEARAYLEDLEANGPTWEPGDPINAGLFPTLASGAIYTPANLDTIWLLDTNPENSWLESPGLLIAGFGTYALDGTLVAAPSSIFETFSGTPIPTGPMDLYTGYGCSFTFWWHEARQMWLVASGVSCYG